MRTYFASHFRSIAVAVVAVCLSGTATAPQALAQLAGVGAPPTPTTQSSFTPGGNATSTLTEADVERIVAEYLRQHESPSSSSSSGFEEMTAEPYVIGDDLDLDARWNHGLEFQSRHGDFRVRVGGRTQLDAAWFDSDEEVANDAGRFGRIEDSINFRRGRLRVDGTMYEVIDWIAEYEFINQFNTEPLLPVDPANVTPVPVMTDLSITIRELPLVGNMRIGNMKDPISFEHLIGSRWLHFMERSLTFDAIIGGFNNGFMPGIMFFNWSENERMTWWVGMFKNVTNPFGFGVGSGEYNITTRVTMLPWYENEGRQLLHLGASHSHRDLDNDVVRFRARGSIRSGPPGPLNPIFADTGLIQGDNQDVLNAETAMVFGPLTLQSEYTASFVNDAVWPVAPPAAQEPRGTVFFQGVYFEALYFLTGEHRRYNRRFATFDRVIPHERFFLLPGCGHFLSGTGAWELGARYSYLNLNDRGIEGGELHDFTLGVNWYLNPNVKLQWNYNYLHRDIVGDLADGNVHGVGMRMAMDF